MRQTGAAANMSHWNDFSCAEKCHDLKWTGLCSSQPPEVKQDVEDMETVTNQNGQTETLPAVDNKPSVASLPLPPHNPNNPIGEKTGRRLRQSFCPHSVTHQHRWTSLPSTTTLTHDFRCAYAGGSQLQVMLSLFGFLSSLPEKDTKLISCFSSCFIKSTYRGTLRSHMNKWSHVSTWTPHKTHEQIQTFSDKWFFNSCWEKKGMSIRPTNRK